MQSQAATGCAHARFKRSSLTVQTVLSVQCKVYMISEHSGLRVWGLALLFCGADRISDAFVKPPARLRGELTQVLKTFGKLVNVPYGPTG